MHIYIYTNEIDGHLQTKKTLIVKTVEEGLYTFN